MSPYRAFCVPKSEALELRPALLSILVGVNDLMGEGKRAQTAEQYEVAYDGLLRQTLARCPG